jgi:hypothetical protein
MKKYFDKFKDLRKKDDRELEVDIATGGLMWMDDYINDAYMASVKQVLGSTFPDDATICNVTDGIEELGFVKYQVVIFRDPDGNAENKLQSIKDIQPDAALIYLSPSSFGHGPADHRIGYMEVFQLGALIKKYL